ncbi:MAG TPA: polysaccharide deacetylase family protein [Xanthobacteraceae bacterium]|nr:polysaccharide deacetylase family protein [Xanthobacteraceae bacterium]
MRRITVLACAGAAMIVVSAGAYMAGRAGRAPTPAAKSAPAQTADADLVTGSTTQRPLPAPPTVQLTLPPVPTGSMAPPAAGAGSGRTPIAAEPAAPACRNPDALGVSRVVEIDTAGGPGFGFEQFKAHDFLNAGEVVLTFDDGPWPANTPAVLAALAAQCVKATFFPIGQHATWHPEILKQVVEQGHTVGSHTWSHADLARKPLADAKAEIEKGASAVTISAGRPLAPFFRFPALRQTPELIAYLGERNIGIFSADLDSFDFKLKKPELVIQSVMTRLKKMGKGIILLHDFQRATAEALPELLIQLKASGYKVVQLKAKDVIATLPEYDTMMMKAQAGQTIDGRPTASVVRTISGYAN